METKISTINTIVTMKKKQLAIDKRWYSNAEAAIYTGFGIKHLENARNAGQLTYHQQRGRNLARIYYEKQHLDEWMERNFKKIECTTDFAKTLAK